MFDKSGLQVTYLFHCRTALASTGKANAENLQRTSISLSNGIFNLYMWWPRHRNTGCVRSEHYMVGRLTQHFSTKAASAKPWIWYNWVCYQIPFSQLSRLGRYTSIRNVTSCHYSPKKKICSSTAYHSSAPWLDIKNWRNIRAEHLRNLKQKIQHILFKLLASWNCFTSCFR